MVKVFDLGALGVWLSYPIADFISGIFSIIMMKRAFNKLNDKVEEHELKSMDEDYSMKYHKEKRLGEDTI